MTTHRRRRRRCASCSRARILVLDGAMGTMIQRHTPRRGRLPRRRASRDHAHDLKGNNDLLVAHAARRHRASIHDAYLDAGADIIETNTFNATAIAQADYGLEALVLRAERRGGAAGARGAPTRGRRGRPSRPRFVAGAIGPDQPHAVDLARRERPGVPRRHLRPGARAPTPSRCAGSSTAASTCCWSRRSSTR